MEFDNILSHGERIVTMVFTRKFYKKSSRVYAEGAYAFKKLLFGGDEALPRKVDLAVGLDLDDADEYLVADGDDVLHLLNAVVGKLGDMYEALLAGL